MNGIGEYLIHDEEEQQQQQTSAAPSPAQQGIYSFVNTNAISLDLHPILALNLTNLTKKSEDDLRSVYKISSGVICACLCLLTITGNLPVLIIFRRIRTVSRTK